MENYERNPETYVSRKILKKSKKLSRMALKILKTSMKMVLTTFAFFGAVIPLSLLKPALLNLCIFVCRSLLETADKVVLTVVDELKDIEVAIAHKQEFISWCGGSRSSCVKDSLKGIVATYDTAT